MVNAPFSTILYWLSRASVGLSTMVDEHFGINIVEFMVSLNRTRYFFIRNFLFLQAAGVIPVTHASGGPLTDIVVHYNGEPTGTKTCLHRNS